MVLSCFPEIENIIAEDTTHIGRRTWRWNWWLYHWGLAQIVAEGGVQAAKGEKSYSAVTSTKPNDQNDKIPPRCDSATYILR